MISKLGPGSVFKQQQAAAMTRQLRAKYFAMSRDTHKTRVARDIERVKDMSSTDKSKFLHSKIKRATDAGKGPATQATYATMTFEGRRAVATNPDQIKQLINSYTHYVSMDSSKTDENAAWDRCTKRGTAKFSKGDVKTDEFDEEFKHNIDSRVHTIREELHSDLMNSPIPHTSLNKLFTPKELQTAIKRLKTKLWKACGLDGIQNWMIYYSGCEIQECILDTLNQCWIQGTYPDRWYDTLISYIYKGKGPLHELTSYRPIALTSTLVNLLKTMMLARIAPVISSHIHESQGGYDIQNGIRLQGTAMGTR